jgi:hypothetical protein
MPEASIRVRAEVGVLALLTETGLAASGAKPGACRAGGMLSTGRLLTERLIELAAPVVVKVGKPVRLARA